MSRIQPIDIDQAVGQAKDMLENVNKAMGAVPNLMRTLAHSPAALGAYLGFGKALGAGSLVATLREQIALTVSFANECSYCVSAHTALGKRFGIDEVELHRNLHASSRDPKVEAALEFALAVVQRKGRVTDEQLRAVREAGYGDGEIVEIIATVGITVFSNYFDHVAATELDFPSVEVGEPAAV